MKKILFILLFICSIAHAQYAGSGIFKTAFIDPQVANFQTNLQSYYSTNIYADTNKYFALMSFWRGIIRANLQNTFYLLYPILYVNNVSNATRFEFIYQGQISSANTGNINLIGSPTINNNGIAFNGVNQAATINNGFSVNLTPRFLLESVYLVSSTDTVANTNFSADEFVKNSSDMPNIVAFSVPDYPKYFSLTANATATGFVAYNENTGSLGFAAQSNRSGLNSLNRVGLKAQYFLRGVTIDSLVNTTVSQMGLARQVNGPITFQNNSGGSAYRIATVQYFAIRKRGYTHAEMTTYNNLVTAMQQRLGRY